MFEWIRSIAAFLILCGLFLQLLPDGSYRKYLRFFSGLVLMILVCRPLLRLRDLEELLDSRVEMFSLEQSRTELKEEISLAEGAYQEQLSEEYSALIREQVADIARSEGYQLLECQASFELDPESEDFGQVRSLRVVLAPAEAEAAAIQIEPVQIDGEAVSGAEEDLLSPIRRELLRLYELPEDALVITLRE